MPPAWRQVRRVAQGVGASLQAIVCTVSIKDIVSHMYVTYKRRLKPGKAFPRLEMNPRRFHGLKPNLCEFSHYTLRFSGCEQHSVVYGIECWAPGVRAAWVILGWSCWRSSAPRPGLQKTPGWCGSRPRGWCARRAPPSVVLSGMSRWAGYHPAPIAAPPRCRASPARLCADERDDFGDHLLQFRWLQNSSTVENDIRVGGKQTIWTNVAVVGQPATGKIRAGQRDGITIGHGLTGNLA